VVGIVARTQRELFENDPRGAVYVPFAQGFASNVFFHVRPATADPALVDRVRQEVRDAAPGLPLFSVKTFAGHVDSSAEYWGLTMTALMFGSFGGLALLVALVGIYGVTAYTVSRRTREIGVRVALGASRGRVVAAIFRRPLIQVGLGVIAGGALIALAGTIETEMPGLQGDLSLGQFAIVVAYAIFMLGVCLLACVVPTRRALGVEPTIALRLE
jgi:ABC-type antimicrobial peptide transport system permease subunit